MRTLFLLISLFFFSTTNYAQSPVGSWVITTPGDRGEPMTWKLTFNSNGTYAVDFDLNGSVEITGKYSIDGTQVSVQNDPECGCCTDKGIYKFGFEDGRLWMNPVDDPCDERRPPQKVFFSKA
jgi:hypothetical protein